MAGKSHLGCFEEISEVFPRAHFPWYPGEKNMGLAGTKQPKIIFVTCLLVDLPFNLVDIYHGHLILSPWCIFPAALWMRFLGFSLGFLDTRKRWSSSFTDEGVGGRGEWRHDTQKKSNGPR